MCSLFGAWGGRYSTRPDFICGMISWRRRNSDGDRAKYRIHVERTASFSAAGMEFAKHAHVKTMGEYEALYKESLESPETFWPKMAGELSWFKKWDTLLDWSKALCEVVCEREDQHCG